MNAIELFLMLLFISQYLVAVFSEMVKTCNVQTGKIKIYCHVRCTVRDILHHLGFHLRKL